VAAGIPSWGAGDQLGVFRFSKGDHSRRWPRRSRARRWNPPAREFFLAFILSYHINNRGQSGFAAAPDTDINIDGIQDTGLDIFSSGSLRLVARTGAVAGSAAGWAAFIR